MAFCAAVSQNELGLRKFNLFFIPFAAALASGIIGGVAVSLGASKTPALCLVAPAMIIVPGVPLINGIQDMIKDHMTLGLARLARISGRGCYDSRGFRVSRGHWHS